MGKRVRTWAGTGYPPEDIGPLTEYEKRQLELRRKLQDPNAGRLCRPRTKVDPDAYIATGMPIAEDECQ